MSESPDATKYKRKRVAKACETCRIMKAKCDGARPSCGRCSGYGYRCAYSPISRRKVHMALDRGVEQPLPSPSPSQGDMPLPLPLEVERLRSAVAEYERLLREAAPGLPKPGQNDVLGRMAAIGERVEGALARLQLAHAHPSPPSTRAVIIAPVAEASSSPTNMAPRYLGEVSDVRFFNLVQSVLQEKSMAADGDGDLDSYEQDDPVRADTATCDVSVDLPSIETADEFLDIYFSTVHVAYPFIQKPVFMATYRQIRDSGSTKDIDTSWIALLYMLFAIGAYYASFPGKNTNMLHEHYFRHAVALSNAGSVERSINKVSFLLAECFYLLAVCRTDRCWTALGLAVRIAQGIGLHVEAEDPKAPPRGQTQLKTEVRRRIWYSLYVLDRLLALQLGRPPAVHDDDCNVSLPSRLADGDINWENGEDALPPAPEGPSAGDYFLSVISLSRIIGYVLRGVYGPRREDASTGRMLASTRSLDQQLLDWKSGLPRTLRFDLGHAFEASVTFRRQRNMLAVKFHHLRALIHRPYLCLRLLQRPSDASVTMAHDHHHDHHHHQQQQQQLLNRLERICVAEAGETAHLLRNIASEKELVYDFPWWQMISCLICASSILLVASVFTRRARGGVDGEFDIATLKDDSETCLKVFEALSANSDGARIARDMMARLKERGLNWNRLGDSGPKTDVESPYRLQAVDNSVQMHLLQDPGVALAHFDASAASHGEMGADGTGLVLNEQDWPSLILDSMNWSAQFFDAVDGSPSSQFGMG